ncbi:MULTISPECIES: hypothetical protein [Mycolicibacterium]|uniref:Transmembrane protein n=1 Tax=Mycolicibacterium lutetiense TaxID=1641992 RepID=A0ABS4ZQ89_9MYCO|nr:MULTISPECIES: hypothetical protein [Mycolicibacterium]MBP2451664.1 hypothetical protein [Mycolicibacterium lutetiense]MCV6999425.1 hypothetical protein [Mycolicibacterium alvei]
MSYLDDAATRWRAAADESDRLFSQYRQTVGDADWTGTGRDAAYDHVSSDARVVQTQGEVQRAAATIAQDSATDQRNAVQKTVDAIAEAEGAGFQVSEDLKVRDTRRIDVATMSARYTACREHAENIQWNADQLAQADSLVGQRLQEKAVELDGIGFSGPTVQAASWGGFKQDGGDPDPWEPPVIKTEQTPSQPTVIDASPPEMFPTCDNIDVWNNIGQTLAGTTGVAIGIAGMPFTLGGTFPVILSGGALVANSLNEMRHCG